MRNSKSVGACLLTTLALAVLVASCGPEPGGDRPELSGQESTGDFEAPPPPADLQDDEWRSSWSLDLDELDTGWTGGSGGAGLAYVCTSICDFFARCDEESPGCLASCVDDLSEYQRDGECIAALEFYADCLSEATCEAIFFGNACNNEIVGAEDACENL